ncbi:hypothetical protein PInf_007963 [Phytophthora infestans]|nr:hypothetical protein PInf_007963 [Phytophthora infestans]
MVFNNNRQVGSAGRPSWFDLSKKEKREVKLANKVDGRVTDLSENVFKTLDSLFGADHVAQPVLLMASGPLHEANDSSYTNSDAYYTDSAAADASPTENSGGSAAPPKETSSVCGKRKQRPSGDEV